MCYQLTIYELVMHIKKQRLAYERRSLDINIQLVSRNNLIENLHPRRPLRKLPISVASGRQHADRGMLYSTSASIMEPERVNIEFDEHYMQHIDTETLVGYENKKSS